MLSRIAVGVIRVTPMMEQPKAIFWCDVHFPIIAVKHLDRVLKLLDTGAPRKPRRLT
jgi:hypothetical protein